MQFLGATLKVLSFIMTEAEVDQFYEDLEDLLELKAEF